MWLFSRSDILKALGASAVSLLTKYITSESLHTQLLQLPDELETRGWLFTVLAILLCTSAALMVGGRQGEKERRLIDLVAGCGCIAAMFLSAATFYYLERYWKKADPEGFDVDFVYFWLEPAAYGTTFGLLSAAITLLAKLPPADKKTVSENDHQA